MPCSTSNLVLLPNVYVVEELVCENECRIPWGTYAPCCAGKLMNSVLFCRILGGAKEENNISEIERPFDEGPNKLQ